MNTFDLTKNQLIELAKMRLLNDEANILPTKIIIESQEKDRVSFIIKSKNWADYRLSMLFKKFYINEFLFLQKSGINLS